MYRNGLSKRGSGLIMGDLNTRFSGRISLAEGICGLRRLFTTQSQGQVILGWGFHSAFGLSGA